MSEVPAKCPSGRFTQLRSTPTCKDCLLPTPGYHLNTSINHHSASFRQRAEPIF
jgi:hypothetical protein